MTDTEKADAALIAAADAWIVLRQPFMGTAAAARKRHDAEREAQFRLAHAAAAWAATRRDPAAVIQAEREPPR